MNDRLEIEGDMREDVRADIDADEILARNPFWYVESHYQDWKARNVIYFSTCYGCGVPMLDGEEYRPDFCSSKCFCETSCIDREMG